MEKEIKFYIKRHKKVYIHKMGGNNYESSQSSDDGNECSVGNELSPTETYYDYESRRIIKYDSYKKSLKKENTGLTSAGRVLFFYSIFKFG